eukprot:1151195_1
MPSIITPKPKHQFSVHLSITSLHLIYMYKQGIGLGRSSQRNNKERSPAPAPPQTQQPSQPTVTPTRASSNPIPPKAPDAITFSLGATSIPLPSLEDENGATSTRAEALA